MQNVRPRDVNMQGDILCNCYNTMFRHTMTNILGATITIAPITSAMSNVGQRGQQHFLSEHYTFEDARWLFLLCQAGGKARTPDPHTTATMNLRLPNSRL